MSHVIKKEGNQFYMGEDAAHAYALITFYYENSDTISIDHTYVDPGLRGQGLAKELIDAVACFAREQNLKIIPICSCARRVMRADDQYNDLM